LFRWGILWIFVSLNSCVNRVTVNWVSVHLPSSIGMWLFTMSALASRYTQHFIIWVWGHLTQR